MNPFRIHMIETNQFKDMSVHVRFATNNDERSATMRQLLSVMMSDRTDDYSSKQAMVNIQDELFGIRTLTRSISYGKALMYEVRFVFLNAKYTKVDNFNDEVIHYIEQVLFHSVFDEQSFQEAKVLLKAKISSVLDYPREFVVIEGLSEAGKGTPLGVPIFGSLDILETLTLDDVKEEFNTMLNEAMIDVLICGEDTQMETKMREMLGANLNERPLIIQESYYVFKALEEDHVTIKNKDVPQANFLITYETSKNLMDPDYTALLVANAILGQFPTSLLFREVREKRSLCYSISSSMISYDGAMIIHSGMEAENVELALDLIEEQVKRIQDGDFSDELLETTKGMIINGVKGNKDSANARVNLAYQQVLTGKNMSIDAQIARVERITKEMVQESFKTIRKVNTMILKGGEVDAK